MHGLRLGLTTRYLLVVLATSVAASLLVGNALRGNLAQQTLSQAVTEQQNAVTAAVTVVIGEDEFRTGLNPERRSALEGAMTSAMLDNEVSFLAIYDQAGDVMLTSDATRASERADVEVASFVSAAADLTDIDGAQSVAYTFPVQSTGESIGLVQVVGSATSVLARTDEAVRSVQITTLRIVGLVQLLALPLLVQAARRLRRQGDDLTESAFQHEYLATHDTLTDLPNRSHFEGVLASSMADPHTGKVGVALIDVNGFKAVNDTLGHLAGDRALQAIADKLRASTRPDDLVARFGGDEFVLLLHAPDVGAIRRATERAVSAAREEIDVDPALLTLEVSAGIAIHPTDGDTPVELLRRADIALHAAKARHEEIRVYDVSLDARTTDQRTVLTQLRPALQEDQFWLAYQPIVATRTRQPVGLEALLRWDHPVHGAIAPDRFIGLAERSGVIHALTDFVLHRGLEQMSASGLIDQGLYLSINVSARDLIGRDLCAAVQQALAAAKLPPWALQLEVTETIAMTDPRRAIREIERIRDLGVPIAIDDYGTGHASLAYLQRLPVQSLKIDQTFVSHLSERAGDHAIVRSTIDLAHNLGILAVGEGVEDEATFECLRDLGCDLVQGYHLGRPAPFDVTLETLASIRADAERMIGSDTPTAPSEHDLP